MFSSVDLYTDFFIIAALSLVLLHEIVNGFHDASNTVAAVIYTRAMKSSIAVCTSGLFNFLGVIFSGLGVAYSIVYLLPIEVFVTNTSRYLIMVLITLATTIFWNLLTWYISLPVSSSHSLIGSIIGVKITDAIFNKNHVIDIFRSSHVVNIITALLLSPLIGMTIAGFIIFILRKLSYRYKKCTHFHMTPKIYKKTFRKNVPPFLVRVLLIVSAIGLSYSHGANDGQKGVGLIILLLIVLAPAKFVLNMNASEHDIFCSRNSVVCITQFYKNKNYIFEKYSMISSAAPVSKIKFNALKFYNEYCDFVSVLDQTRDILSKIKNYANLDSLQRYELRKYMTHISDFIDFTIKLNLFSVNDVKYLKKLKKNLISSIEYAPIWVVVLVAMSLSIGTIVGWKKMTDTIGKNIGKTEMTYAHGITIQMTSALSIGIASYTGIPISTTHILASSMTGVMLIDGNGIQINTVRNILLSWLLTIPICSITSCIFYWILL